MCHHWSRLDKFLRQRVVLRFTSAHQDVVEARRLYQGQEPLERSAGPDFGMRQSMGYDR